MPIQDIYEILLQNVPPNPLKRVLVGVNWTMVEGPDGCGLAQTPRRDSPGCQPIRDAGSLNNLNAKTAASWIKSNNPMEKAIGMASINATYNRYDLNGELQNGLDTFADVEGPVTVVGRFPGLKERINDLKIIEKEPREDEYPEDAAAELFQISTGIIITAATLVNGSAPNLFELAKGKRIALVGPGTPMAPALFEVGIEVLAGLVIEDVNGAADIISQSGAVRGLKECGRHVTLRAMS